MVRTWKKFENAVRSLGLPLLSELYQYPDAVLVAGCQRSGTTAVTRIIRDAGNMPTFKFTADDELDAALILSGNQAFKTSQRTCFQTTYLNDRYMEYHDHSNYRLVWILRRPDAVACSMLYNWKRDSLNRLFRTCGSKLLNDNELRRYKIFGAAGFSRIQKICKSYNSKTEQIQHIAAAMSDERLLILDYDDLVLNPALRLKKLFDFLNIPYSAKFETTLHSNSIRNSQKLSTRDYLKVNNSCHSTYQRALELAAARGSHGDTGSRREMTSPGQSDKV